MVDIILILGRTGVVGWFAIAFAIIAIVLVFRFKVNSTWLIVGGVYGVAYKLLFD